MKRTTGITSTTEVVHGLLRLDGDQLRMQWRTSRATDRVGAEIRSDREMDSVREHVLALLALNAAERPDQLKGDPDSSSAPKKLSAS